MLGLKLNHVSKRGPGGCRTVSEVWDPCVRHWLVLSFGQSKYRLGDAYSSKSFCLSCNTFWTHLSWPVGISTVFWETTDSPFIAKSCVMRLWYTLGSWHSLNWEIENVTKLKQSKYKHRNHMMYTLGFGMGQLKARHLTHWGQVTPVCVSGISHHWIR